MERMGIAKSLEDAGMRILAENCLMVGPLVGNHKTLMTNSGKFASYIPLEYDVELVYGSLSNCIDAVTQ